MDYLYDDSFDGLLTCIYEHYYCKNASGIYSTVNYQPNIFNEYKSVETDYDKARKVIKGIKEKISFTAYKNVYYNYLSSVLEKENNILKYLIVGFKLGKSIDEMHTREEVLPVHKISRQVSFEAHRFTGLLRFVEVGTILYAAIEPDHNILPIIADHFTERLKNENLLIHDTKRNTALAYNKKEWIISEYSLNDAVQLSEKEKHFQQLWKGYFEHISIESRKNLRLQQQFVPKKYRKYLTEFTIH